MHSDFPTGFFGLELDLCVTWAVKWAGTHARMHTRTLSHTSQGPHDPCKPYTNKTFS